MVNIPLFIGFYTSQVVVWDFFHQQYDYELVDSPYGFLRPLTASFPPRFFIQVPKPNPNCSPFAEIWEVTLCSPALRNESCTGAGDQRVPSLTGAGR